MPDTAAAEPQVRHKLQVYFDAHECRLSDAERADWADDCDTLAKSVGNFPTADLRVVVGRNGRSNEFAVKLTLLLPGQTFVSSDHDAVRHAAFERALVSLQENVTAYKERMSRVPERRRAEDGTVQELAPSVVLDAAALLAAADAGDYPAFRAAVAPYEDALRARAGRWVERYPEIQARVTRGLDVGDVAEGVFLAAFEGYAARPDGVRFGDWLEGLLDPVCKAVAAHPDAELENIGMARSACDAAAPPKG